MRKLVLAGVLLVASAVEGGTAAAAPSAPAAIRVDAIGDSITWGVGTDNPATDAYPVVLGAMIGAKSVRNQGRPYAITKKMLELQVPAMDPHASVVVINAGTNDIARFAEGRPPDLATREASFTALLAAVRSRRPNARIVVLTLRMFAWNLDPAVLRYIHAWNDNVRAVAPRYGAKVLDLETDREWYVPGDWASGNQHTTTQGARHLARAIAALLR